MIVALQFSWHDFVRGPDSQQVARAEASRGVLASHRHDETHEVPPGRSGSLSIDPSKMWIGQMKLAAGIRWENKTQTSLLLKRVLDFKVDLMLTPLW